MHIAQPDTASIPTQRTLRSGLGTAHAKAILIGEHAAVYGAPAMAIPVLDAVATARLTPADRGILETELYRGPVEGAPSGLTPVIVALHHALQRVGYAAGGASLAVTSNIPMRRGLGSSATVAAAVVDAVVAATGARLDRWTRWELVQEAETIAHGTPSGIDAAAVLASGPIFYRRGQSQAVPVGGDGFTFVLADTGEPSSTATAVARVRQRRDHRPAFVDSRIEKLADLTHAAAEACQAGSIHLVGAAMNEGQEALEDLGVSSNSLDRLVESARDAGAVGAKLTGGGMGGCIIALAPTGGADALAAELRSAGATRTWISTMEAAA